MIHQYQLGGLNIVIDVNSGAVHVVDEVAYDIIALYETASTEEIVAAILDKHGHLPDVNEGEIRECIADIEALKVAGKLFSADNFSRLAGKMSRATSSRPSASTSLTPATCAANTASPHRGNTTGKKPS